MNIIFLDMDGVVNSDEFTTEWFKNHGHDQSSLMEFSNLYCKHDGHSGYVVPELVERLKRICDETDCRIVWSSSWRENYVKEGSENSFDMDTIKALWKAKGLPVERLIGCSPCLDMSRYSYVPRGCEAQKWLDENAEKYGVEKVAILDDGDDADVGVVFDGARFFQTTFEKGLTQEIADSLVEWFNDK